MTALRGVHKTRTQNQQTVTCKRELPGVAVAGGGRKEDDVSLLITKFKVERVNSQTVPSSLVYHHSILHVVPTSYSHRVSLGALSPLRFPASTDIAPSPISPRYHDALAILKGARNGCVYGCKIRRSSRPVLLMSSWNLSLMVVCGCDGFVGVGR